MTFSQSDTGVQGQEVDVQEEDGVDEERLLRFELITDEQRRSAIRRPEHTTQLQHKNKQTSFIKFLNSCFFNNHIKDRLLEH